MIVDGEDVIARVDLHFATSLVYGILILEQQLDPDDLAELRVEIDENLVQTADVARDDFLLAVYQGQPVRHTPLSDEDDLTDDPEDDR